MSPSDLMVGPLGLAIILAIALFVHEPWRWLGLYLGNALPTGSEVFVVVKTMATALVAGLVMRLILFPAGALADVGLAVRLFASACGVAVFLLAGRNLGLAVFGAAIILAGGEILMQ